jgi:uncharacterized protein (DUF2236 family)
MRRGPDVFAKLRTGLFQMLSGDAKGTPRWVEALEAGDDEGYFGPASAVWAVNGGIPVLVAGMRALLLQTLHPGAMAGVHDWSRYREDPLGRLNGTVRWVLVTTFGDREQAELACAQVGRLHTRVNGNYERDGEKVSYSASDPELLSWVHVAFTDSFLRCHETWGGKIPGGADSYVREWAATGELMGVSRPPTSRRELADQLTAFDPQLRQDQLVHDAVRFIRRPALGRSTGLGYRIIFAGAVATLPVRYRELLGVRRAWWPAVTATRLLLWFVSNVLGRPSMSERYARRRIARLVANADA